MSHRRFKAARWLPLPALLLLFGGLVVEIHIRGKEVRARGSLGGALGRATLPDTAGEQVRKMFEEARALVRSQDPSASVTLLDRVASQAPHSSLYELAAIAHRAAGQGDAATRDMQLAARLAPGNARLATRAEQALDLALLDQARPYTRLGMGLGAFALAMWLLAFATGRRAATRLRKYLDSISGRLQLVIDDQPGAAAGVLGPDDEQLIVDLYLKGRYGMRPIKPPRHGPPLHLALSNAASGRTVRVTPVRDIRHDAVRVHVKPETVDRLRTHPGRWRVQASLGDRRVALAELRVLPAACSIAS